LGRQYWLVDVPAVWTEAVRDAVTKGGGSQFGKPCPRFMAPLALARGENSCQTVGLLRDSVDIGLVEELSAVRKERTREIVL